MYLAPQAGHAPHHVSEEWADKYKGRFDQGYEAIRAEILARQKELGLLPDDTELSPINPHGEPQRTGPDGQPWPLLDTVRPWDSLSADEQRLFSRMAEVFAGFISYTDDQLGRVLDYLEESGQLDNTIDRRRLRQRRERRGRPERQLQRVALLQRHRRLDRRSRSSTSTSSEARSPTTTTTPAGRGRSTRRSRTGSAGPATRAASPTCASSPGRRRIEPQSEPRQQYIHAVDVVPTIYELLGIEPPAVIKGYEQSPIEGESFAASLTDPNVPGKETQFYAMLGQRSIYHQGWLACTVHPPLSGWGKFDQDVWELYHLETDRAQSKNLADQEPERLEQLKAAVVRAGREAQRAAARRPHRARTGAGRAPARRPGRATATSTTPTAPTCPRRAACASTAARTRSPPGSRSTDRERRGRPLRPRRRRRRAQPVRQGRAPALHVQLGRHAPAGRSSPTATSPPGAHVFTAEFAVKGQNEDPAMPGFAGTLTLYIDDEAGRQRRDRHPARRLLPRRRRHLRRPRQRLTRHARLHRRRSASPAARSTRSIVDVTGERYIDHEAEVRGWFMQGLAEPLAKVIAQLRLSRSTQ